MHEDIREASNEACWTFPYICLNLHYLKRNPEFCYMCYCSFYLIYNDSVSEGFTATKHMEHASNNLWRFNCTFRYRNKQVFYFKVSPIKSWMLFMCVLLMTLPLTTGATTVCISESSFVDQTHTLSGRKVNSGIGLIKN